MDVYRCRVARSRYGRRDGVHVCARERCGRLEGIRCAPGARRKPAAIWTSWKLAASSLPIILHQDVPARKSVSVFIAEQGKYVIFFRSEPNGILVSRILHQRMLPGRHGFADEDNMQ